MSYTPGMDPTIAAEVAQMTEFMAEAGCGEPGLDPDIFFPDPQEDTREAIQSKTLQAKTICWTMCPVRETCLQYALAMRFDHGIFGGLTPAERKKRYDADPR